MADTTVGDQIYSFEIARRAVARAALHLGIDSMTEQVLDVMADILLQYLTRTGRAMSHLAESSRRTSAHVNVLDAFQACQLVASPAVGRLHLQEPEEEEEDILATPAPKPSDGTAIEGSSLNGNGSSAIPSGSPIASVPSNGGATQPSKVSSSSSSASQSSTGWKGLAAFVFGPNWLQEKDEEDYLMELAAARSSTEAPNGEGGELSSGGAGGKVFPSSLANGDGGNHHGGIGGDMGNRRKRKKGWDAPFPDEVPAFPRASSTCANPHALPARVTGGLVSAVTPGSTGGTVYRKVDVDSDEADEEEQETVNELEALSDEVFLPPPEAIARDAITAGDSAWGSIDAKSKLKLDPSVTKDEDGDVEMQPATKKVRIDESSTKASNAGPAKEAGASTDAKGGVAGDPENEEFLYVPNFYPRPPSTKVVVDNRRTVVDGMDDRKQRLLQQQRTQEQQEQQVFASADTHEETSSSTSLRDPMDSSRGVRSSLISLGNNRYWGSGWDKASSSKTPSLAVPMGRKVGGSSASGGPGGRTSPDDPIVPMSRASGSRVSRVLEGSMDAAAMQ